MRSHSRPSRDPSVFETAAAKVHAKHASIYEREGIPANDLPPDAVEIIPVVPPLNLKQHVSAPNLTLTIYGSQATVPIVPWLTDRGRLGRLLSVVRGQ